MEQASLYSSLQHGTIRGKEFQKSIFQRQFHISLLGCLLFPRTMSILIKTYCHRSRGALFQHARRACYACFLWHEATQDFQVPSPTDYGYTFCNEDRIYLPKWELSPSSIDISQLIVVKNCKCSKANVPCLGMLWYYYKMIFEKVKRSDQDSSGDGVGWFVKVLRIFVQVWPLIMSFSDWIWPQSWIFFGKNYPDLMIFQHLKCIRLCITTIDFLSLLKLMILIHDIPIKIDILCYWWKQCGFLCAINLNGFCVLTLITLSHK